MRVSQAEIDRRVQMFVRTCRLRDMKVTHQRIEIFRELAASVEHPDAETVYQNVGKRVPSISRDTVYRTLSTLETEGLIRKKEADNRVRDAGRQRPTDVDRRALRSGPDAGRPSDGETCPFQPRTDS